MSGTQSGGGRNGGDDCRPGLASGFASELDFEVVLDRVLEPGRALLGARTLVVLLLEGDRLVSAAVAGEGGFRLDEPFPVGRDVLDRVLREERVERADDDCALLAPMTFEGQGRGVLAALGRADGEGKGRFGPDDEAIARSFAAAAATAIFTARGAEAEQLQRVLEATEQERRRWARELHDETLQELGGISVALEAAAGRPDEAAQREALVRAMDHTQRCIEGVYALINELRPPALDQLGLRAALEALVDRAEGAGDVELECVFESAGGGELEARLPAELETAVYRLVQEAVNNAIKHSGARRIEIRLADEGSRLSACVSDDGAGFDPEHAHEGYGLTGMSERAALLGGQVAIESRTGHGTTVRIALPMVRAGAPTPPPP